MSTQRIIPSLIAALALVLATGCGPEGEEEVVAVHSFQFDNGEPTPVFKCIGVDRQKLAIEHLEVLPLTLHDTLSVEGQRFVAHADCAETPIWLHPSIRGVDEIVILPQGHADVITLDPTIRGAQRITTLSPTQHQAHGAEGSECLDCGEYAEDAQYAPIELSPEIARPNAVVWMVPTTEGAHLLPATLTPRIHDVLVLVPNVFELPAVADNGSAIIELIDLSSIPADPTVIDIAAPADIHQRFTVNADSDTDEEDGEEDDDA